MKMKILTGSITRPNDTTQYAAGDVVNATSAATIQFLGITSIVGSGSEIKSAAMVSSASQGTKLDGELWLFSSDITDLDTDNAAFTPTDAQLLTLVGIIAFPVASWKAGDATAGAGGNSVCVASNVSIAVPYDNLYGVIIARNTYTPVANEVITAKLEITRSFVD